MFSVKRHSSCLKSDHNTKTHHYLPVLLLKPVLFFLCMIYIWKQSKSNECKSLYIIIIIIIIVIIIHYNWCMVIVHCSPRQVEWLCLLRARSEKYHSRVEEPMTLNRWQERGPEAAAVATWRPPPLLPAKRSVLSHQQCQLKQCMCVQLDSNKNKSHTEHMFTKKELQKTYYMGTKGGGWFI